MAVLGSTEVTLYIEISIQSSGMCPVVSGDDHQTYVRRRFTEPRRKLEVLVQFSCKIPRSPGMKKAEVWFPYVL